MPTIRLSGTITARSPIMITRPEQGDRLLTMNVVRNESLSRVHVIPGETIKGPAAPHGVCGLCRRRPWIGRPDGLHSMLFYRQTAGGTHIQQQQPRSRQRRRSQSRTATP